MFVSSIGRSNKVRFKILEGKTSEASLDLDALLGFTEISLETEQISGFKHVRKLGLSLGPSSSKVTVPSQMVSLVPRYVIFNESEEVIVVRQCHLEVSQFIMWFLFLLFFFLVVWGLGRHV